MKKRLLLFLALLALTGCAGKESHEEIPQTATVPAAAQTLPPETTLPEPPESDETFVRVLDYIPTASQELMYATEDNFTGQVIYDFEDAYLRWGTVKKLMLVSRDLEELGLYIKIWDGFRPVSAQFKLWEVCPNPTYVANPTTGYSSHSRGNTIDLTIVYADGNEVMMPTEFDDTTPMADRVYDDCSPDAAHNSQYLEDIMVSCGFWGYWGEWWHYTDNQKYPVEKEFNPGDLP